MADTTIIPEPDEPGTSVCVHHYVSKVGGLRVGINVTGGGSFAMTLFLSAPTAVEVAQALLSHAGKASVAKHEEDAHIPGYTVD